MASDSFSQSYSNPEIMNSEQSDWGLQLSKMLQAMGQAQFDWAASEYDKGMRITQQNVDRYLQSAGQGTALASQLMTQYRDVFEPIMNDYVQQAKSYNSEERQRFEMGKAESTVAQADQAARDAAERKLQGFGINPNSGRYQDLILTGRLQDAAARAGAGTEASLNTAAIGRQMTEKAAQMGQNVPGMTVNALNSANQGIAGAQGAMTSMMNTGVNMRNSAANFGSAAGAANRLPQIGQKSASVSRSQNDGGGSGSGSDKNKQGGGQGDKNPYPTDAYKDIRDFNNKGDGGYRAQGGGTHEGGTAGIMHVKPYGQPDEETVQPGVDEPQWQGPDDPYWQGPQQGGDEGVDDFASRFGGQQDEGEQDGQQQDYGSDDNYGQQDDYGAQQDFNTSQDYDYGDGYSEPDQSDFSSDDDSYAAGGGVMDTRTVPPSASQSRGRQTDDVPARLNVGEYVIPKDVVTHKGHEFFQNVIKKSRQNRLGVSGPEPRGQMKPALRMRPTFSTANRV